MKRWLADTLFMRLFLLMWFALVLSHVAAFMVATRVFPPDLGHGDHVSALPLPTFPSLPPTPGLLEPAFGGRHSGSPAGGAWKEPPSVRPGRPDWGLTLLDYGIRMLIIGVAAWLGARWLSAPMRRLTTAAHRLGTSLGKDDAAPLLDEQGGTIEVRDAARVFNQMAGQLRTQFRHRGLLVAALSHDLRTPLTRMRMHLARLPEGPPVERCVRDIRDMDELIDSALVLFQGASGVDGMQKTDVCSVVQALTDDLIEQGQPVTFSGVTALAHCQPALLRRVVSNLVSNAVRYGKRADVSVSVVGGAVQILVSDEGPGIPENQMEAVLEPFYRLEGSRSRDTGGTGLGLYIARDLITRQAGTLTLVNRPEGGLQAVVCIPAIH
jgi:signal transduction histidine kinase